MKRPRTLHDDHERENFAVGPPGDYTRDVELVIADEKWHLCRNQTHAPQRWTGLALSSGGLPSTAFSLGVARACSEAKLLETFHYLSGVGGGALSSGLIAWLHKDECPAAGHPPRLTSDISRPPTLSQSPTTTPAAISHATVDYVRQHAVRIGSTTTTTRTANSSAHSSEVIPSAPVSAIALFYAARSGFVYGSLLMGVFFLLSLGEALLTLIKPALFLLTRLDLWSSIVECLNFGLVCSLVPLLYLGIRSLFAPLLRLFSLALHGPVDAMLPAASAPLGRGLWWFLAFFLCGLVSVMAIFSQGTPAKIALLVMAPLSVLSFVRFKANFSKTNAAGSSSRSQRSWAALLSFILALITTFAVSGVLFFYLLKSGVAPPGQAAPLAPGLELLWGILALFFSAACFIALPAKLESIRKRWRLAESAQHEFHRVQKHKRQLSLALRWFGVWLLLGSVVSGQRLFSYFLPDQVIRFGVLAAVVAPGYLWFTLRASSLRFGDPSRDPELHAPVGPLAEQFHSPWARAYCALLAYATLMTANSVTWGLLDSSYPQSILIVIALALLVGKLSNTNFQGLSGLYRERVGEAFFPTEQADKSWAFSSSSLDFALASCSDQLTRPARAPLLLLNTSLETTHSASVCLSNRGADSFVLSPLWCGSTSTGFRKTSAFQHGRLSMRDAMVVSSLDLALGGQNGDGSTLTGWLVNALLTLIGVRRGYFALNPNHTISCKTKEANLLKPGLGSFFFDSDQTENAPHLCLQDGRYFDELGLYELFRRKLDLIVVSDATSDPTCSFRALGATLLRSRADFGVSVSFAPSSARASDHNELTAASSHSSMAHDLSERGYLLGQINYPAHSDAATKTGTLIYIKPVLMKTLPLLVQIFAKSHHSFPHAQPNDAMNEQLFDAYEQLGHQLAHYALSTANH